MKTSICNMILHNALFHCKFGKWVLDIYVTLFYSNIFRAIFDSQKTCSCWTLFIFLFYPSSSSTRFSCTVRIDSNADTIQKSIPWTHTMKGVVRFSSAWLDSDSILTRFELSSKYWESYQNQFWFNCDSFQVPKIESESSLSDLWTNSNWFNLLNRLHRPNKLILTHNRS